MFLLKVGKSKKFAKIKAWTGHIITHFWHCCETCAPVGTTSEKERISNLKVCTVPFSCIKSTCNGIVVRSCTMANKF